MRLLTFSLGLSVSLGCASARERDRLTRVYDRQAEVVCGCRFEELGFVDEDGCLDDYRADYVGENVRRQRCLAELEADHDEAADANIGCRIDAEERFTDCAAALTCDDTSAAAFVVCEIALVDEASTCPRLPTPSPECGAP